MDVSEVKTELNGRVLLGDGDSIVELPFLYGHILKGGKVSHVFVPEEVFETQEVKSYNQKFKNDPVKCKESLAEVSYEWIIPKKFKDLDIFDHVKQCLIDEIHENNFTNDEIKERVYRTKLEMRVWKKRNLLDMLRTLVYVVNTFEEHKIAWGAGRGSSCASYVLYLIGLHQVDSVLYDLDISEFFR